MSHDSYVLADDAHKQSNNFVSLKDLLSFAGKKRGQFLLSFVGLAVASSLAMLAAWYFGQLIENGLGKSDIEVSIRLGIFILSLEISSILVNWVARKALAEISSDIILTIRKRVFEKLQLLPMRYFDRTPQGRTITRVTNDIEELYEFFSGTLGRIAFSIINILVAGTSMLLGNFVLGSIMILSMAPVFLVIYFTRKKMRYYSAEISKLNGAVNASLSENIKGIELIRSMALENWAQRRYRKAILNYLTVVYNSNIFFSWSRPLISFLCYLPLVLLVLFGGNKVLEGAMPIALFVAYIRYCDRFSWPILSLSREVHLIQKAFTNIDRVMNFLRESTEEDLYGLGEDKTDLRLEGKIEFKNLTMAYNAPEWILKRVSFQIRPGEVVGLLGRTGSGKTTIVSLIARLYDFQQGDILIDDVSVRDLNLNALRKGIGFIGQDAILFRGNIRDNLVCLDNQSFEESTIREACRKTGLLEILAQSGRGLDSEVLDEGSNLSAGEKQLISLTRVFLLRPSILIMDEATANIDPDLEQKIHQVMNEVMRGKTCLMIAHRIQTVLECDRLLVFEQGELVEDGSPKSLMQKQGHFYDLVKKSEFESSSVARI